MADVRSRPSPFKNTVFKKYIMAVSGLIWVGFVIGHLAGNLTLLDPTGGLFNRYAHHLESLGAGLILAEIALVVSLGVHIYYGIQVSLDSKRARPVGYADWKSKGAPSKSNFSSNNMLWLGLVLLIFIVVHVRMFKYGAHYTTNIEGMGEVRDLGRLVMEQFSNVGVVLFYVVCMLFLWAHLRHGFWSAFQSLGLMNPRYSKQIYALGVGIASVLAFGYILLPVWVCIAMNTGVYYQL